MVKLQIEYLPTDALKPYRKNARVHDADDVEALEESIEEFDFSDPEVCEQITAVLQEKQNAMDKEYDRMADRINLARTAASHAPSVDAFCDFCDFLDDLQGSIDTTYWTEAADMKSLMLNTVYQARELLEEPDYSLKFNPTEHNLQLLWINDE